MLFTIGHTHQDDGKQAFKGQLIVQHLAHGLCFGLACVVVRFRMVQEIDNHIRWCLLDDELHQIIKMQCNVSELVETVNKQGETKTTKVTLEKSWFTRGNKLLISGVRRENMFIPKKDWNNHYPSVALITGVNFDLNLKMEREKPGREVEE